MFSRLAFIFCLLMTGTFAHARPDNDNQRLPIPLWMGQRFHEVLNLPLFYFLVQRPTDVSLIDLALVLNGKHPDMPAPEAQMMAGTQEPSLLFHTLFLHEGGKAEGFRPMTSTEMNLSLTFIRILNQLAQETFDLEGLVSEYRSATDARKKELHARAVEIRGRMVKALNEGLEISGDVGTSVHANLRAHGAMIDDESDEVVIHPYLKFPHAGLANEDLTEILFDNLHLFLNVPQNQMRPLKVGVTGVPLWLGTPVELRLNRPWHERLSLKGYVMGYTYWARAVERSRRRMLLRDPEVWREMQAYVLQGTQTRGVIPETQIMAFDSSVLGRECAHYLVPPSLLPPGFQN